MFDFFNRKKDNITRIEEPINTMVSDNSRFDIKEAYNELRTNISFSIPKKECKVICLTSAIASEGKSTTSSNNAITFAKSGKKILLIDCDLRKPTIDKIFSIKSTKGLSDVLVSEAEIDDVINRQVVENLDIITSGKVPPNPVELLSSEIMINVIEDLRNKYDYIFIDAPPINVVIDAVIISKVADGMVLVVRPYVAERGMVKEAIKKLEFAKAKIIGIVLNDVATLKSGYGYSKNGSYEYYK